MGMSDLLGGFATRFGQGVIESSLTFLIGLIVAGVFRRMVGPDNLRRLFGGGVSGLLKGWFIGMLLPVCALGVIPVAREMLRAGVRTGTVLSFLLAAPLLNPISFLYGLTLAEPFVIVCFAAMSLLTCSVAGLVWDRVFAPGRTPDPGTGHEPMPEYGPRRLLAVAATAARELTGRSLLFYAVGLIGSAVLASLIPFGSLQNTMAHGDPTAPIHMALMGVPIYSSPLPGMMKIGLMFEHGNSIGAAFVLFAVGIGVNVGVLAWLAANFPPFRVVAWALLYVAGITAAGYVAEPLLYDERKAELDHTHAFDDYSNPSPVSGSPAEQWERTLSEWDKKLGPMEEVSLIALGVLLAGGLVLRRADRHGRVEAWLTRREPPAETPKDVPWWNRSVPGSVLGAVAILGLILSSVLGAYVYYPDKQTVFDMMTSVRADAIIAVRTGERDEAVQRLEIWDDLTRKLQVGVYIREGRLPPGAAELTEELRELIEHTRDHLLADDLEEAKDHLPELERTYRACRDLYLPPQPAP